ncbi:unnamed protein product [Owenia fusiformis]|uniref:Uncharacterized protein n=1 Tax=Owenia fusiformis TaxID=6347 RepID=A0A8J1UMY6_OWEFU|nr:unnamed protein product [Owenia fusiformis]
MSALMYAAWSPGYQCMELLIDNNADINAVDNNGNNALIWATKTDTTCTCSGSRISSLHHKEYQYVLQRDLVPSIKRNQFLKFSILITKGTGSVSLKVLGKLTSNQSAQLKVQSIFKDRKLNLQNIVKQTIFNTINSISCRKYINVIEQLIQDSHLPLRLKQFMSFDEDIDELYTIISKH